MSGMRGGIARSAVVANCDYVGPGYGQPTPGMTEAVLMLARLEGVLLDPVYSGKAMAGLIDLIRKGEIRKGETVVFLHTGGAVGLFGYTGVFEQAMAKLGAVARSLFDACAAMDLHSLTTHTGSLPRRRR